MTDNFLKIYIAGPYSAESEQEKEKNANSAIDVALALFQKGHFPYAPHLTHWVDKRAKESSIIMKWPDWMKWHNVWLEKCDALLYLSASKGADIELKKAKELGKLIFYSIDDIPDSRSNLEFEG